MLDLVKTRTTLSHYLLGNGIEIGALDGALPFAHDEATIRYVDRMTTEDLRKTYPTLAAGIRHVDYVVTDDTLPLANESQDFVIANHVIEHLVNPLGALKEWNRVLKDDGILFMAYPIPKYCGDKPRRVATLSHLVDDLNADRRTNADEHLLAWFWAWSPASFAAPDEVQRALEHMWTNDLWDMDERAWSFIDKSRSQVNGFLQKRTEEIHQHVFELETFRSAFEYLSAHAGAHFSIDDLSFDRGAISECIIIAQKHPSAPKDGVWSRRARAAEARELYLTADITAELELSRERLRVIDAAAAIEATTKKRNRFHIFNRFRYGFRRFRAAPFSHQSDV